MGAEEASISSLSVFSSNGFIDHCTSSSLSPDRDPKVFEILLNNFLATPLIMSFRSDHLKYEYTATPIMKHPIFITITNTSLMLQIVRVKLLRVLHLGYTTNIPPTHKV